MQKSQRSWAISVDGLEAELNGAPSCRSRVLRFLGLRTLDFERERVGLGLRVWGERWGESERVMGLGASEFTCNPNYLQVPGLYLLIKGSLLSSCK